MGRAVHGQGSYATPEPIDQNSAIPSVNGQGNRSDYFFTDGLSNFGAFHSVYAVPPIIDEIQEFKVVSHADSAEYGSVTGGVVNVVTKSGTNDFHGSAFEYFRNAGMDAHQAFTGTSSPSFTQNEFGGVVGGPVLLPKLYDGKKKKTFFFGAYQGFRFSQTQAKFIRVPTAAQLTGDLSDWPTQIFNPFTTAPDPANPGQFTRQPYTNNQITPDPNMVAWAKFVYPTAGPALDAAGDDATDSTPTTQTINQWTARIDQKIGQNDSAWFRYSRDTSVVEFIRRCSGTYQFRCHSQPELRRQLRTRLQSEPRSTGSIRQNHRRRQRDKGIYEEYTGSHQHDRVLAIICRQLRGGAGKKLPSWARYRRGRGWWRRRICQPRRKLRAAPRCSQCQPIRRRVDEDIWKAHD